MSQVGGFGLRLSSIDSLYIFMQCLDSVNAVSCTVYVDGAQRNLLHISCLWCVNPTTEAEQVRGP